MPSSPLCIDNLSVSAGNTQILHAITCMIEPGSTTALIGRNGSGKSSLAYTIMGYPDYTITGGSICHGKTTITTMDLLARARHGIFLAMQNPPALPGISVYTLLKEALRTSDTQKFSLMHFTETIESAADKLEIPRPWLHRPLDSGFSGGERKKIELLQCLVLEPAIALIDEIDAGADSQTRSLMANAMHDYSAQHPTAILVIISHQQDFLVALQPTYTLTMVQGTLAQHDGLILPQQEAFGDSHE